MLSRFHRILLLTGLLLWAACTATVDLDGLTGGSDDDGSGGAGAALSIGGNGGSTGVGGSLVPCSIAACVAVCNQGCVACGLVDENTCANPTRGRAQCMCQATTCEQADHCMTTCFDDGDCAMGEMCDLDAGLCYGASPVTTGPTGFCCTPHSGQACPDDICGNCVCQLDATCCDATDWPSTCANIAVDACAGECNC